jgi:hypothetical protein
MQPVRRTFVTLLALVAFAGAARGAEPKLEAAAACARISAEAERLACFDGLFGARAHPTPASPPQAAPPVKPAMAPESEFGLTAAQREAPPPEPAAPAEITSRVSRVITRGPEPPMLELENGQQWVLLESMGSDRFRAGDAVTIRSGALGSFLASMPERKGAWRVRRIK